MTEQTALRGRMVSKGGKGISKDIFFIALACAVAAGFYVGAYKDQLYASVAPLFGIKTTADTLDFSSVQKVYRELKTNYDGKLDNAALVDGAARGMVAASGDRYTVFMDKKEADEFNKDLSGQVSGVGAEIGFRASRPTITRVLDNSPAAAAGLQKQDVILGVNDESVAGLDTSQVAAKIRGDEGTTVKITVRRGVDNKDFSIVRAKVGDSSVRWRVEDEVGIITMTRFDTDTSNLARQAVTSFKDQNVKGVILDLRDDGGGYLDQAKQVAGIWLNNKIVVSEKTDGKTTDEIKTDNEAMLEGVKTVVLVNGGSASASEIVAGALQDHSAATLVGEKTFGKGSVQKLIPLPDGRQLKVTVAKWYTPKGKNITKEGISPDQKVTLTSDDTNAGRDPQLDAAKGVITQ